MPSIAHIANLWSLVNYPTAATQWSLDKKIRAVKEAGFDGFTTGLTPEHAVLAKKYGLKHVLGFVSTSSGDPKDFAKRIQSQKDAGAVQINVQLDDHDTPPALATKHWIAMEKEAAKIGGVVLSLEVHRDCCTETPEKTYEIARLYKKATGKMIRINFDFSHFSVVKHLGPGNYVDRLLDHPALVQNGEQSHCRPFNGHHCQVPVTYKGKLSDEAKSYLDFCVALFKCWKASPKNKNKTLFVCPEMGPYHEGGAGYNISGLPPAWPDAVILRKELDKAWKRA